MTNYEKIKAMNKEELADLICNLQTGCACCKFYLHCLRSRNMGIGIKNWLESEASPSEGETSK